MKNNKSIRSTVYLEPNVSEILRECAFLGRITKSEIANDAVKYYLSNVVLPELQLSNVITLARNQELLYTLTGEPPF